MAKNDILGLPPGSHPSLFGQKHSSRDYSDASAWGKNQFNSSFPASLVAYMASRKTDPVYLRVDGKNALKHTYISPTQLLGIDPLGDNAYYNFEAGCPTYEKYYKDKRENIDLVMMDRTTDRVTAALEIKLTALPDNTTGTLSEEQFGCEIVVRPPTINFLACSICDNYDTAKGRERLRQLLEGVPQINHWEEIREVAPHYNDIKQAVLNVSADMHAKQTPLIMQPVWKTQGLRMQLATDCLDVFAWSNLALLQLCCSADTRPGDISRHQRTIIWVYKMLWDFSIHGIFDYVRIIKNHSYNYANDKAFSISGLKTRPLMDCKELTHPRISKEEIKNIILGGGQYLLSPERRFDAVIANSPDLFLP